MIQAQYKYREAKTILNDIILSFNNQLEKQESRLESTNSIIENLSNRETKISKTLENHTGELKLISDIASGIDLNETSTKLNYIETELNALKLLKDDLLTKISNMEKKSGIPYSFRILFT